MFIQIEGVTKKYGDKEVLCNISLEVERGKLLALLGPSGCGKTTLLNALAGLVDIDDGRISVDGTLYSSKGYTLLPERRKIGMVFQDFALWPHMTVFENVAFGLKVQKLRRRYIQERVMEVLHTVRMDGYEKRYPHQLSGGQKQRVAIARALAPEPTVLLMDEPLSSLDAKLRDEMRWQLIDIVERTGVTTVYVTHDQVEALSMAQQVVLLNQGRIEQQGSPVDMYTAPRTLFSASFIGASNLLNCSVVHHLGHVATAQVGDVRFSVQTPHALSGDDNAVLMIRPGDIEVVSELRPHSPTGTGIEAVIEQRAFQGHAWQYKLKVLHNIQISLELWDDKERPVGQQLYLWIPREAARLIRTSRIATSV